MISNDEGDNRIDRLKSLISKIAEAINCSLSDFTDEKSFDSEQNIELLQLWSNIKHERDRNKVLSFIRTVVQNQL